MRATGFVRDPEGHRWTPFKAVHKRGLKAGEPKPRPVNYAAPVSNQITVGQCVAHGLLDSTFCNLRAAGIPIESPFSHRVGYAIARAIDRAAWLPMGAELPPLADDGSQPNQLARAMSLYGCPLAKDIDGGTLDAIPELANRELMLHEAIACKRLGIDLPTVNFVGIGDNDGDKLDQCQAAIDDGMSFAIAIEAGPNFDACDGSVILKTDGRNPNHMIHVHDMCYDINGRRWFIQNSWGESWGSFGRAWVNDGFLENAQNILVPKVTQ